MENLTLNSLLVLSSLVLVLNYIYFRNNANNRGVKVAANRGKSSHLKTLKTKEIIARDKRAEALQFAALHNEGKSKKDQIDLPAHDFEREIASMYIDEGYYREAFLVWTNHAKYYHRVRPMDEKNAKQADQAMNIPHASTKKVKKTKGQATTIEFSLP